MLIGEIEQKANIRFKIFDAFATYNKAIDVDYDSEDNIFTGWLYILNTPELNRVSRSQNRRSIASKQVFVEYVGNICYIPTSDNCFLKGKKDLTGNDYTEDF